MTTHDSSRANGVAAVAHMKVIGRHRGVNVSCVDTRHLRCLYLVSALHVSRVWAESILCLGLASLLPNQALVGALNGQSQVLVPGDSRCRSKCHCLFCWLNCILCMLRPWALVQARKAATDC